MLVDREVIASIKLPYSVSVGNLKQSVHIVDELTFTLKMHSSYIISRITLIVLVKIENWNLPSFEPTVVYRCCGTDKQKDFYKRHSQKTIVRR